MKERIHIGFFGCRNVGKSSLVNAITNQEMSVVSNVKGTTTDAVKKAMELLPLGKVLIIDTPGYDDEGELGEKRIKATKKILNNCDIAILITEVNRNLNDTEKDLIKIFNSREVPYIIVKNKIDINSEIVNDSENLVYTSAINNTGIEELKNAIAKIIKSNKNERFLVKDLIKPKDIIILVTPIDSAAPKNRLILPQQIALKEIVELGGIAITVKETELEQILYLLNKKPKLVITDSQVFKQVNNIIPKDVPLTSFSILMARYKGFLHNAQKSVNKINELNNNSKILISEGCTHHKQCDDIGTVKLPKLLNKFTGVNLNFEWTSGNDFPNDLSQYDLIIHCGGCMVTTTEMQYRMKFAQEQNIPFTNYGIAIAYMNGILERSLEIFKD